MITSGELYRTARTIVQTWQDLDLPDLTALLADPVTMVHWPAPLSAEEVGAWLDRAKVGMADTGCARWRVVRRSDGATIGDVGIVVTELQGVTIHDLGYIIDHRFWRQGYALEVVSAAIAWARDQGITKLTATMAADNVPSAALAERLGMTRVRTFRNANNRDKLSYWYELSLQAEVDC